jgi:arylsulfatase A-like enzyme
MSRRPPNIVFIMSDDHASHAISSYGSKLNRTPSLDRIAEEGMRFDNCFCTNSICTPSRAVIMTGLYSHRNGVRTLRDRLDNRDRNVAKLLQHHGYQTAMIGKWHLGHGDTHDPAGFDYWNILPRQGDYQDPEFVEMGVQKRYQGYVTDIITELSLDWLKQRDADRPFFLMCHHKAPHRPWTPNPKHAHLYEDVDIPIPPTFHDDYATRGRAAKEARMRIDRDLTAEDLKEIPPAGLAGEELKHWKYQRYMKDYLRCVASIDENVGKLLDYLDEEQISEDSVVIYTSDQGFFLGDHGWFDKRFMYEESLRMPFLIRYPRWIRPGSVQKEMALNVDFAQTFLELAGAPIPEDMQGSSLAPLLQSTIPPGWQQSIYYRYWEHLSAAHYVGAHYGIRTHHYKLIYYYGRGLGATGASDEEWEPEWELFDLAEDPYELCNVYHQPGYQSVIQGLKLELKQLRERIGDTDDPSV